MRGKKVPMMDIEKEMKCTPFPTNPNTTKDRRHTNWSTGTTNCDEQNLSPRQLYAKNYNNQYL